MKIKDFYTDYVKPIITWLVEKAKAFYTYCQAHPRFTNGLLGYIGGFATCWYFLVK